MTTIVTTCLMWAGLMFCYATDVAPPVSNCVAIYHTEQWCYVEDITTIPVRTSTYDPTKCDESPINCNGDPDNFATGRIEPHHWGTTAACPFPLLWKTITVSNPDIPTVVCRDTGGAILPTYGLVWAGVRNGTWYEGWYLPIDYLLHYDPSLYWAYGIEYEWSLD